MSRGFFIYLLLALAPAGVLAVLALRVADRDHADGVRLLDERLEEEGDALARRLEAALDEARQTAARAFAAHREGRPAGPVLGFARDGAFSGYSPEGAPSGEDAGAGEDELRLYRLSARGGESFELAGRDPDRAIDAYSFYLHRLRSGALAARLRLRLLRAAIAANRASLAAGLARGLQALPLEWSTEEGLPIALLAAEVAAREKLSIAPEEGRPAVAARLLAAAPRLSNAALEALGAAIFPGDAAVAELLAERRRLEQAVRRHPGVLAAHEAALGDGYLLVAQDLPATAGAGPVRALAAVPLVLPDLDAGPFAARWVPASEPAARDDATIHLPLRAGPDGPEIARLEVRDPSRPEQLERLDERRSLFRALVGVLVAVTIGGAAALAIYLARERQLVRLRERLLANVSHELKTPVTSIRMVSELLAEHPFDAEKTQRFGHMLHAESLRLSRIIENVLDYSRLESGRSALEKGPLDLVELVCGVGGGFAARAEENGVKLRLEGLLESAGSPVELVLSSSGAAVERIVNNLLDNALKYGRSPEPEIRLGLERRDGHALVRVADNGRGVPDAEREKVFEPFYRCAFEDFAVQGAGLGLSISRSLARQLGGDVRLERSRGGCVFVLSLPLDEPGPLERGREEEQRAA